MEQLNSIDKKSNNSRTESNVPQPKLVFFKNNSNKSENTETKKSKKINNKSQTSNHNIFELHSRILQLFDSEYIEIEELKKRKERLEYLSKNGKNEFEKLQSLEESKKLQEKIYLIESGIREAQYLFKTNDLLKEYEELLSKPVKIDFMGKKTDDNQNKMTLITRFINIAKNYINDILPIRNNINNIVCEDCTVEMYKMDDLLFVCPKCSQVIQHLASIASYQDNNRINSAQRYVYDKRAHFGDSIKKFQAKQNTTIPQQVYDDLWEKIASHDLKIEQVTKDHIYEFLRTTKHTEYYEDIILVHSEITGIKPPDISHLEGKLFELFDEIDPVYERIKPKDRVNFLNGQFVLFKLLQKLKYPCKEEDFYILKTRDKMLEHDKMWKSICHELKWTFISTV